MDHPASSPVTPSAPTENAPENVAENATENAAGNNPPHNGATEAVQSNTPPSGPVHRLPAGSAAGDAATLLSRNLTFTYTHSGPLPDPHHFAAYDEIHPGAANRILVMAENALQMRVNEQLHIQTMQASEAAYAREGLRYGAALAFIIVLGLILIAILGMAVLADTHTSIVAVTALGGFGALGLVGILVNGRKAAEKPRSGRHLPHRSRRRSRRK